MLCFFRDAACPFCHFRIYELCNNYLEWKVAGLEIIAVFSDTADQIKRYVANHPRPFELVADPDLQLYNLYGVEQSSKALIKALFFNTGTIIKGFMKGARASNNPHFKIVPADFIIDESGKVSEVWYGRDTADHIPMENIVRYVEKINRRLLVGERYELNQLRHENKKLKALLAHKK